ncbi:right-handed parallel beta-helix repeat-containing protein [Rhizobium mongolense]|uniref:Parallel beta-helix repeat protein n=2 Tax=Rhizobium mongolense TaxID=57676 RepID=A0ABR6IV39_9HYPH|nr:right-handed parallel beta-helix repeat-containing protein [Rhizobium mongolense]MBB4231776.1 parallel beta-helix repeat protein [Rhizobium mongolense]TVZ66737.1 parallel beta-helix repeat protein [Rhizobium mongolense USDA 1844]
MRFSLALMLYGTIQASVPLHAAFAQQPPSNCTAPQNVSANFRLDRNCRYTGPILIDSSNVTLDCDGATIDATRSRNGITIEGRGIRNATVKSCKVDGAKSEGIFIKPPLTAPEMAALPKAKRYDIAPQNVSIIDSTVTNSGNVGIYVGNYAQSTLIRNTLVTNSGSTAIYLDASSVRAIVENSTFKGNGFGDPLGRSKGKLNREAIAIDSSAYNTILNNNFSGNSAGGVFLYKNCWERHNSPKQAQRWQHSSFNTINGNRFTEKVGVWIASRQAKNLTNWNCGDPPLAPGYFRDYADHNTIVSNVFTGGNIGVIIQDDFTTLKENRFFNQTESCVVLGSELRDSLLGAPIEGTTMAKNSCVGLNGDNGFRPEGESVFEACSENFLDNRPFNCGGIR